MLPRVHLGTILKRADIDLGDVAMVGGLSAIGAGLAMLFSLAIALIVVGTLVFCLAVPPRQFLRS